MRKITKRVFTVYFSGLYMHLLELLKKTSKNEQFPPYVFKISVTFWFKAACVMLYVDNITKHA
jgi:hypothetical protein